MRNILEMFASLSDRELAVGGYILITACLLGVVCLTFRDTKRFKTQKTRLQGLSKQMKEAATKCFLNIARGSLLLWLAGSVAVKGDVEGMVLFMFTVIFSIYDFSLSWEKYWEARAEYLAAVKSEKKENRNLKQQFVRFVNIARQKAFFVRRKITMMKISRATMPVYLAAACLLSSTCAVALDIAGISGWITTTFRTASIATLFVILVSIAPIPLAWNQKYLNLIKETGAVHYTNGKAAESIVEEGFIRPSNRRSSYSNLFRRCAYLSSPSYREVTLSYNKMKGKVDENSVEIFVPYNEETFAKAKFRLVDMAIMIPGGIKL